MLRDKGLERPCFPSCTPSCASSALPTLPPCLCALPPRRGKGLAVGFDHYALGDGGSVMATQRSVLNGTSRYDDFLFAAICDEPGGMPLSVLSAFARMNVDPWDEAARLATLSTPDAQKTLVSTLNLFPGKRQRSAETEILAARLIALLPKARAATTPKAAAIAGSRAQGNNFWLMWLCFAIAMSFLSQHQHATTTSAADATSTSNASPATKGSSAKPAPSDADSRPDSGSARPPTTPSEGITAR